MSIGIGCKNATTIVIRLLVHRVDILNMTPKTDGVFKQKTVPLGKMIVLNTL